MSVQFGSQEWGPRPVYLWIVFFRASPYSARNASTGEMWLVRNAGTREATNADNPSAATAIDVTEGLNGFTP